MPSYILERTRFFCNNHDASPLIWAKDGAIYDRYARPRFIQRSIVVGVIDLSFVDTNLDQEVVVQAEVSVHSNISMA